MNRIDDSSVAVALALFVVSVVVAVSAVVWGLLPVARRTPPGTGSGPRVLRIAVGVGGILLSLLLAVVALPLIGALAGSAPDAPTARSETGPGVPVEAGPTRVILTPTEAPTTSQSFSWLAGDASHRGGLVQLRPTAGGDVRTVDAFVAGTVNGDPRRHFSATATGLEPATAYEYRVGLDGGWSDWHEFTTADPGDTDFRFISYGDAQVGLDTTWPSVVRQAEETAPDAVGSVHAGDLVDAATDETQWADWFSGMAASAASSNVIAAPGNHEFVEDASLRSWKANFEYPRNNPTVGSTGEFARLAAGDSEVARQYAAYFAHWADVAAETVYFTDYQGVRFITLNATQDPGFLSPEHVPACAGEDCPADRVGELWIRFQAAWLDRVLEASPATWNVVTFHRPVFSASEGRDEPILRRYWVPVLERHDVALVLMGHDHVYARGHLDDDRADDACDTDAPVYVVSNSGAKHYPLAPADRNVWTDNGATQVVRGQGVTTYQVVDVSEDRLVARSYLAGKAGDATTDLPIGAVYDEFTVTRIDGRMCVTEAGVEPPS